MAYIYQADLWCDKCGEHIKTEIARETPNLVPEDPDDETTFDSADYPKRYDAENEESDSPDNCASGNCGGMSRGLPYGKSLENRLTQEGYRYLKSMLDEHGASLPEHAQQWAEFYEFSYHDNPWTGPHDWLNDTIGTHAALIQDIDGSNTHAAALVSIARELMQALDADSIQDAFQSDMDSDGYFKETGWYSSEMDEE